MTLTTFEQKIASLQRSGLMRPNATSLSGSGSASMEAEDDYAIPVGGHSYVPPEDDALLLRSLEETAGWLREAIAEYQELEVKLDNNTRWLATRPDDHPRYAEYRSVYEEQKQEARALLERMRSLRELGIGEAGRMGKEGARRSAEKIDRFIELADWVADMRHQVAIAEGAPF